MGGIDVCRMGTRAGSSFLEGLGTNNSVSELLFCSNSIVDL